jgi:hypothetical protein
MLNVNEILMANDGCTVFTGVVRVVAAAADTGMVALMQLNLGRLHAPFTVAMDDIQNSLRTNAVSRVQEFVNDLATSEEELTKKQREELALAEEHMRPLLDDLETLIFDPKERGQAFEHRALERDISDRTLRRHFYDYLSGGMTKFALIGAAKRISKPQTLGSGRRGGAGAGPSLPVVREQLADGARRFYLNGKHTMQEAFVLTLKKHFRKCAKLTMTSGAKTSLSEILKPTEQLPTLRQFRYVCECLEAVHGRRKQKPGQARVPKEEKLLVGKARDSVLGPGYRFEIDATRIQEQLVSRFCRRFLVGESNVYGVVDVWSGAITGYNQSINPPSWEVARAALLNCFTDKGEVFERLGLNYTSQDWPCCHLPSRLAADRGELVSNKAGLVPEFGIKVEIMPTMCAEAKGTIERKFKSIKHGNNFYLRPGRHAKSPGRREDDGKTSAALTPDEQERIIVEIIQDLNNEPVPLDCIPSEVLDAGYKSITHIGLYVWGLEHRPGYTRTLPPKDVFAHLLSKATAKATSSGIKFQKQNFRSPRLVKLGYRSEARPISIGYVDGCADRIWFYDNERHEMVAAENDHAEIRRSRASFREAELFLTEAEQLRRQAKHENIHRKSAKAKRVNQPTKAAIAEAQAERRPLTKTRAKAEIRLNGRVERQSERHRLSDEMAQKYASQDRDTNPETQPSAEDPRAPTPNMRKSLGSISREIW